LKEEIHEGILYPLKPHQGTKLSWPTAYQNYHLEFLNKKITKTYANKIKGKQWDMKTQNMSYLGSLIWAK